MGQKYLKKKDLVNCVCLEILRTKLILWHMDLYFIFTGYLLGVGEGDESVIVK